MKFKIILVIIILSVIFTACGRSDNGKSNDLAKSTDYTRTLNILVNQDWHKGIIEQATIAMNNDWQARGYPYTFKVKVEDNDYRSPIWPNCRMARLSTELMSGQGPDMFLTWFSSDFRSAIGSGLIADIYMLMDNCPRVSREDFFENVFSAFEVNGGLYTFPISFGFYHVGINTRLPKEYIHRFTSEPTVTIGQMLDIYLNIKTQQEFDNFALGIAGSSINSRYRMIEVIMGGFIDFDARISSLMDEAFVSYIGKLPQVFGRNVNLAGRILGVTPFHSGQSFFELASDNTFTMDSFGLTPVHAFLGDELYFAHYRPLADEKGRLLIDNCVSSNNVWAAFSINASGQQELAWEFMQHLIFAYSQPIGNAKVDPENGFSLSIGANSFSTPIKRSLVDNHLQDVFNNVIELNDMIMEQWNDDSGFVNFITPQGQKVQTQNAINRIIEYNEMPMTSLFPMLPWTLFVGSQGANVSNLMSGAITAETFAQLTHNAVSLWLIE